MRELVRGGELGPLQMMHTWYYNDWLYRPRLPEELDTALGGGVTFRQGAHQFDILRLLGGGLVRSVRAATGVWDPSRPTEGSHTAFLDFENGVVATAVYNGYDHFHTSELTYGIGAAGGPHGPAGAAPRALGEGHPGGLARRAAVGPRAPRDHARPPGRGGRHGIGDRRPVRRPRASGRGPALAPRGWRRGRCRSARA